MPYFAIAASVSPPPAMLNAGDPAIARAYTDARITTIYEGTTGIQANDLMGRKVAAEKGATAALTEGMRGAGWL